MMVNFVICDFSTAGKWSRIWFIHALLYLIGSLQLCTWVVVLGQPDIFWGLDPDIVVPLNDVMVEDWLFLVDGNCGCRKRSCSHGTIAALPDLRSLGLVPNCEVPILLSDYFNGNACSLLFVFANDFSWNLSFAIILSLYGKSCQPFWIVFHKL